jgi:hypothetical protein
MPKVSSTFLNVLHQDEEAFLGSAYAFHHSRQHMVQENMNTGDPWKEELDNPIVHYMEIHKYFNKYLKNT